MRPPPILNKTIVGAGLADDEHIDLEDREEVTSADWARVKVPWGIESCIGNTPLFKIKSLSRATGCEILGKAEVTTTISMASRLSQKPDVCSVSQWWWWESQRSSSA